MAATLLTAIGLGIAGFSAYEQTQNASKQHRLQNEAADVQQKQADANRALSEKTTAISMQQEAARKKLALMAARNAQLQLVRQTQLARATALSRAAASGAQFGSSFAGADASITNQAADQRVTIDYNLKAALQNFSLNDQLLKAQNANSQATGQFNSQLATIQTNLSGIQASNATYGALGGLGSGLVNNADKISNVAQSFGGLFGK